MAVKLFLWFLLNFCVSAKHKLEEIYLPKNLNSVKIFSADEIARFDGSDPNLPLFMAVRGVVFDVSSGSEFYGKEKSYNALTGKDSSRAVAKMSLHPADLIHDISDLTDEELKSLEDIYTNVYKAKYPVVGYMEYLVREKKQEL